MKDTLLSVCDCLGHDLSYAMDSTFHSRKQFFRELVRSLARIADNGRDDGQPSVISGKLSGSGAGAGAHTRVPVSSVVEENTPNLMSSSFRPTPAQVKEYIRGNCELIRTVPRGKKVRGIENRIKRLFENTNTTKGTLQRYLEKGCGLLPYQAKRIIDDQIIKYNARMQLEDFRCRGVKMVRWCPGECEHHRPSHITPWPSGLAGCVFPIDKPPTDPATGRKIYPGDEINCHCYLEAVE